VQELLQEWRQQQQQSQAAVMEEAQEETSGTVEQPADSDTSDNDAQSEPEHIKQQVQTWLQQLSLLLKPAKAGSAPDMIPMSELRDQLPVPRSVLDHYQGMGGFVNSTPELFWRRGGCIALKPQFHRSLRRAAAAAAAAAEGEESDGGAAAAVAARGCKRSRKQQQQQQDEGQDEREYTPPKKRHATAANKARAAARKEEEEKEEQVAAAAREWLQQLAVRLAPQKKNTQKVAVKNLHKKGLSIPECVIEHYGSVVKFVKATPGLHMHCGDGQCSTSIFLTRALHKTLRAEAAAAADGADSS
jgi:hypothetical protein